MCGIVGFTWKDDELLKQVTESLAHRGPDDMGTWSNNTLSLGHRRLSIIDLSTAGHQPMFFNKESGAFSSNFNPKKLTSFNSSIIFNGEIYNYVELREELIQRGFRFTTATDTEIILAAYSYWGEACVEHFNGMWAFCIYNYEEQTLFLSRDRMGQKPLYYTHQNNSFVFGSEMKVFSKMKFSTTISEQNLQQYLAFGTTSREGSIFRNINKLEPAHNLVYDIKSQSIRTVYSFWKTDFTTTVHSEEEAKHRLYKLLDDSVKKRLIADVPVGAFLSGGVDSSVLVYFMQKYVSDLKTFSISFDHEAYNESSWAKKVAEQFQTQHYEIKFTAKDVHELINTLPTYFDEPFGDPSMIPTFLVSKVAREQVTVSLSGTGSDELFAGYPRHQEFLTLRKLLRLPYRLKKVLVNAYKNVTRNEDKANKLFLLLTSSSDQELYLRLFSFMFRSKHEPTIDQETLKTVYSISSLSADLKWILNFEQQIYLPEDLLVKEDRATMGNSLEGRIPFLDYRVVEFANSIPSKLKLKGRTGKYILKKTFEGKLPNEILYRKKQGFGVPLPDYFRNELKKEVEETIFDFSGFNYYNKDNIKILWRMHQSHEADYSRLFWNILMFNRWFTDWKL